MSVFYQGLVEDSGGSVVLPMILVCWQLVWYVLKRTVKNVPGLSVPRHCHVATFQGEEECLPCLHGCKTKQEGDENEVKSKLQELKQDADDMCMICYTENLSCAPFIQVSYTSPVMPVLHCPNCSWSVVMYFITIVVTWHSRRSGLVQ